MCEINNKNCPRNIPGLQVLTLFVLNCFCLLKWKNWRISWKMEEIEYRAVIKHLHPKGMSLKTIRMWCRPYIWPFICHYQALGWWIQARQRQRQKMTQGEGGRRQWLYRKILTVSLRWWWRGSCVRKSRKGHECWQKESCSTRTMLWHTTQWWRRPQPMTVASNAPPPTLLTRFGTLQPPSVSKLGKRFDWTVLHHRRWLWRLSTPTSRPKIQSSTTGE